MSFDPMNIRQIAERIVEEALNQKPLKRELMRTLHQLFEIYSPSGAEQPVVDYCVNILRPAGFDVIVDKNNNIIASRGKVIELNTLVCINAHTDTVQSEADMDVRKFIVYDWTRDAFHTRGRAMLGGDDKCGVAVALTLAAHTNLPMKIVLTTGEEAGSTGAHALDKKHFDDVAFTFTVDRMHGEDLVSEYCGLPCAPDTFVKKFIELSDAIGTKFKESHGTYADTYILCKYKPAVNLSSGYYNPHSRNDFVIVEELYKVMMAIKNAINHKVVLEQAIAQAPEGWQKPKYQGFDDFGIQGGFGGYYGSTMWGHGGWYGAVDTVERGGWKKGGWKKGKLRDISRARPLESERKYGVTYPYGKRKIVDKCRIDFAKSRGLDDKELKQKQLPPAAGYIQMYVSGSISDSSWDNLLSNGVITRHVYQEGVNLKVGRKKKKLGSHIELRTREERIHDYVVGLIPDWEWNEYVENGIITTEEYNEGVEKKHRELTGVSATEKVPVGNAGELIDAFANGDISTDEWDYYVATGAISPADYDIGFEERNKTDRYRKAFDQEKEEKGASFLRRVRSYRSKTEEEKEEEGAAGELPPFFQESTRPSNQTIDTFEVASEKLGDLGLKSGYQKGSVYDMIFTLYATGEMADDELVNYHKTHMIDDRIFDACQRAKTNYFRSRTPARVIETTGKGKIYEWGEETEIGKEKPLPAPLKREVGSTRERLAAHGFKSGYVAGTDEDDIFLEYMIGGINKMDLWEGAASYVRDRHPEFVAMCINAKEEFDDYLADMEIQEEWGRIDKERDKMSKLDYNKQRRVNKAIRKSVRNRNDIRELLIRWGFKSGFNAGDPEDDVFVDYLSGKISKRQLQDIVLHSLFPYDFVSFCVKAKEEYLLHFDELPDFGTERNTDQCRGGA